MNNPMAQLEPVEQRFGQPLDQKNSMSIEGTDIVENGSVSGRDVLEALKDVIDPELGINIVDLGLVYGVQIGEDDSAIVEMTLTSAACPLTDVIERQAQMVLASLVTEVTISWVWMPPWGPDRITSDGREQLRALGFNV